MTSTIFETQKTSLNISFSRSTSIHGKIRISYQHHYNRKQRIFKKIIAIIIINTIQVLFFIIMTQRLTNTILKRSIDNTATTTEKSTEQSNQSMSMIKIKLHVSSLCSTKKAITRIQSMAFINSRCLVKIELQSSSIISCNKYQQQLKPSDRIRITVYFFFLQRKNCNTYQSHNIQVN